MADAGTQKRKVFYGWVVVGACFFIWAIVFGIQFSFGIFFKPLQEAFGWSRGMTSGAMTVHLVAFALFMVPAGWAMDHWNVRVLFSAAALLIGGSLALCSQVSSAWQLYLLYGLPMAAGTSVCGPAVTTLITRWFSDRRGLALGITSAGVGLGITAAAPLTSWLILHYGWREAYLLLGAATGPIVLICAQYIRTPPPEPFRAGAPPGAEGQRERPPGPAVEAMTLGQAVRTREILLIMAAATAGNLATRVAMIHIVPHAIDIGISPFIAALSISTMGAASLVGRLVMGYLQDRWGVRRSMLLCLSAMGVCMLLLPLIRNDLLFFAFAVVFGFAFGGDIPQLPSITAQCFGLASLGVIYGLVITVAQLTGALGPIAAGYAFDLIESYTIVFLGTAAFLFGGVFCIARIRGIR